MKAFPIGPHTIDPPVLLAPMEDVTGAAFRLITKRIANPGLVFTEFVSAMAIHHNARKTIKKMVVHDVERPVGIQIFGGEPETMANAARLSVEMGADLVDINMGCWVPKVCKTGAGAALLNDPRVAEQIVQAVVKAVDVPVTVKVRAGYHYDAFTAPELAKRFEQAGVKMLTLHARFAKQGFDGEADWRLISALRDSVSIPLIGNGDVRSPDDAFKMFRETGCDGVMVGRAAIGNPWALRDIVNSIQGLAKSGAPSIDERIDVALEHVRLAIQFESEGDASGSAPTELIAIRKLRGVLPLYIKGEPGAPAVRNRLTRAESYDEIKQILFDFRADTASDKISA